MKLFKKNQIIIYVIALMLVTAGYLNYTTNDDLKSSVETSMQMESKDDSQLADIGDAKLVSSNDIVSENNTTGDNPTNTVSQTDNINVENTTNTTTSSEANDQNQADTNLNSNNSVETNNNNVDDYFTKSKLERDTMYSQMIETYEKILNSDNSLETQKQSATQEITKINDTKNSIMICENLIKTKGFNNSVIFVNGESISVIIAASEIKQDEVAQIQNIISREMNAKIENIHISNK